MSLIAGLTGRAAVHHRGEQSRSLLSVFPLSVEQRGRGSRRPPGHAFVRSMSPRNRAMVPFAGMTMPTAGRLR